MEPQQQEHFDVVVVGAGAAGVAAATTAARHGARVAIVEKMAFSGGLATSAYVGTICGLYTQNTMSSFEAGCFANEFRQRIIELEARSPVAFDKKLYFLPYTPWAFERVCDDLLNSAEVFRYFHSFFVSVQSKADEITALDCLVGNEPLRILASSFVDASGEGVLSRDVERIESDNYQAPGYVFSVDMLSAAVDNLSEQELSKSVLATLIAAEHDSTLLKGTSRCTVVPGSLSQRSVSLKFAYPTCRSAALNELSELEQFGRTAIRSIFKVLRKTNKYFETAKISFIAPQLGIRSGPRGLGHHVLSGQEVRTCKRFSSAVARGVWPMEKWGESRKAQLSYLEPPDAQECFYHIPVEALCSKSYLNLYFCGRGISADEDALSSARVIGTSLATGSAAGVLAAGHAQSRALSQTVARIQQVEQIIDSASH